MQPGFWVFGKITQEINLSRDVFPNRELAVGVVLLGELASILPNFLTGLRVRGLGWA